MLPAMIGRHGMTRPAKVRSPQPGTAAGSAGFTLIEVLIVLLILGLIAAVVAGPQLFKYLGTAKTEAASIQIERISAALDLYRLDTGRYPSQENGLDALVERPAGLDIWNGPYMRKRESITDPWGRQFVYRIPGVHSEFDLFSLGADDSEGGEGEDQDVTNW